MFYERILEIEGSDPQSALLQVLVISSESVGEDKAVFPGEAIFHPIKDRNSPLVLALRRRGVDLTAKTADGNTALHLAAALVDNADIVTKLLEAGLM